MTNDEGQMTKEARMSNDEFAARAPRCAWMSV
jgi:hypothetical protein